MSKLARRVVSTKAAAWLVLGVLALPFVLFWWAIWSKQQSWKLSSKSPNFVFRMLFHQPAPPNISDIKYLGETLPGYALLRFRSPAPDKFITSLRATKSLSVGNNPAGVMPSVNEGFNTYAQLAGWQDFFTVKHPKTYEFSADPVYPGWSGEIVVDSASNTVYIYGYRM